MSSATPIESLQMQLQELEHALTKFTKSGTASRKVKFPGVTAKGLKLEIAQVKSQLKSLLEAAKAKPYSPTPQFPAAGSHSPFQQSTPEHETAGKGETNSNGMDIDPTWTQNGAIDPALLSSGGPDNSQMPAAQVEKDGLSNILERDDQVQKDGERDKFPLEENDLREKFLRSLSFRDIHAFMMAWSQNQIRITTGGSDTTTLPALYSATLQLARSGLVILRGLGMDSDTVKWPISEETKIMVEHAIALREWLAKYMDVADPIAANNTGISAPVPPKPVYQPGFPQPDIIASAGSQGATLRIFDYKTSAQCELTRAIARDARKNMEAYPGTIEAGPEVAMAIFKNHVGARKCVTHSETNWRGKSVSARFGHLECGCPNILALVELFVKKIVAQDPGYIAEAKELGRQMRTVHSEYKDNLSFTLGNLLSIQHSLQLVSGLSVEKLLQPKINRLLDTSEWAVDELISLVQPEHRELLGKVLVDLRNVAGNYRVAGIQ